MLKLYRLVEITSRNVKQIQRLLPCIYTALFLGYLLISKRDITLLSDIP